jgi:hypothetical protein
MPTLPVTGYPGMRVHAFERDEHSGPVLVQAARWKTYRRERGPVEGEGWSGGAEEGR